VDITNSRATSMGDDSEHEDDGYQRKKEIDPYVLDQMNRNGIMKSGRWE
jgi:hypothetical protein